MEVRELLAASNGEGMEGSLPAGGEGGGFRWLPSDRQRGRWQPAGSPRLPTGEDGTAASGFPRAEVERRQPAGFPRVVEPRPRAEAMRRWSAGFTRAVRRRASLWSVGSLRLPMDGDEDGEEEAVGGFLRAKRRWLPTGGDGDGEEEAANGLLQGGEEMEAGGLRAGNEQMDVGGLPVAPNGEEMAARTSGMQRGGGGLWSFARTEKR